MIDCVSSAIHWPGGSLAAHAARGDATLAAWIITAAYFVVAALCCRAARREWRSDADGSHRGWLAFWPILCVAMIALGLNKQFDLQTDLTVLGRQIARSGGWYQHRREFQILLIAVLSVGAAGILASFAWLNRQEWQRHRLAMVGTVYLLTFILIRAASFHHVDTILFHLPVGMAWINTFLEAGGQVLIGIAAHVAAWSAPTNHPTRP